MKRYGLLILALSAFFGCAEGDEDPQEFDFSSFENRRELKATEFATGELDCPKRICLLEDKLLIVNYGTPRFISVYDARTGKFSGNFLSEGRSENEVLAVDHHYADCGKGIFAVSDLLLKKTLIYSSDALNAPQNIQPERVIETREMADNVHWLRNRGIVYIPATLNTRNQIAVADSLGNVLRSFAPYPAIRGRRLDDSGYEIFMPQIVVNDEEDRVAVFSKNADRIGIYSIDGKMVSSKSGPEHFYPHYVVESEGSLTFVRPVAGKSRMAYFDPVARGNKIWVMYNGGLQTEPRSSRYILSFSWEGEPVDCFSVEEGLIDFDVAPSRKTIYALHRTADGEHRILRYGY